jgi:hypothetical protein
MGLSLQLARDPSNFMSHLQDENYKETRIEMIEDDFMAIVEKTRKEPGLSIHQTAEIIKDVYRPEEVQSLIKELSQ